MKIFKVVSLSIVSLIAVIVVVTLSINFYPDKTQEEEVTCTKEAPSLKKGKKVKVLSWNVQYMASKNYVFFYDEGGKSGGDIRPSHEDIDKTLRRVVEVILKEKPDIVLLQEVDEGAGRTDNENQTTELLKLLPRNEYACLAEAFYWKSAFVPHPKIMGSVGMKLVALSKYKMTKAVRHSLPIIPSSWFMEQFHLKRAHLEVQLSYDKDETKKYFSVLNTHFSAFAQGTDTMEKQVKQTQELLDGLSSQGIPWIIAGDFNLLPGKVQYDDLEADTQKGYLSETELTSFFEKYQSVPSLGEATGSSRHKWFTHNPNSGRKGQTPDRTIDYIFLSQGVKIGKHYVLSQPVLDISDHLPVVTFFRVP